MGEEPIRIPDLVTDRYATLELISWWRQDVVRSATAMVVGAGALGNEVLKNLALMGIARLLVVDFDTIEDANLSRSVLFRQEDRGRRKAMVAAARIKELNPDVQTEALHADINDVGLGVFRRMDLVIGCLDNRQARLAVNRACWHLGKPWVDGGIQDLSGVARVFWPGQGACYECTLTKLDWQILRQRYSCPWLARRDIQQGKVPTTPVIASLIAAIQVQEGLKLLHEMPVQAGQGLFFDGRTNELLAGTYPVKEDCQSHWRFEAIAELPGATATGTSAGELLHEVRQDMGDEASIELAQEVVTGWECAACHATEEMLLPLSRLATAPTACPQCGGARKLATTHRLAGSEPWLDRPLYDLGIPPLGVISARRDEAYGHYELTGDAETLLQFR